MHDTAIHELAEAVAGHLDGFTVHDPTPPIWLVHPDGRRLALRSTDERTERVEVAGIYPPRDEAHRMTQHSITVAAARGPQVIAREITRRLLPGYTTDLATVHARIAKTTRDAEHRASAAHHLLSALPGASVREDKRSTTVRWHHEGAGFGSIELLGDGNNAAIEVRCAGGELVRQIAALVGRCAEQGS